MKYCPICGTFSTADEQTCSNPSCDIIEKALLKSNYQPAEMLQATTENRFCGYCNKVFAQNMEICPKCHKKTDPMAETHLKGGNIVLLSSRAKRVWDP
ncbi:MAG: hypothetical protein NTZ97_03540 [Candidatus Moranbacteria bacterium]|nr:hypothetical protein [Candidatus Moranbacteria bacterium]